MAEAGRVVAGTARGVRLLAPGPGTRPLADRVKQAVFGSLDPELPGAVMLDLCAGSGGAAIEALSRGAARAVLVEKAPATARIIGENLRRAGVADRARVVRRDATDYLRDGAAADGPFDLVILDPPYADTGLRDACLAILGAGALEAGAPPEAGDDVPGAGGLLAPDARVVVTAFAKTPPPSAAGLLRSVRERRFGETLIVDYRVAPGQRAVP
jgi:16S rRNA (guanine966-N2)-methyltransferase